MNYESTLKSAASASIMDADAREATPGERVINQIHHSLDQLIDTITSMEKTVNPVLRHLAPEATSAAGEVREAGQSPIHQTLLDIHHRIQVATQNIAALRNRVTL